MRHTIDPRLAISIGQLQELEDFVAAWRAYKNVHRPQDIDEADSFNELDETSEHAAEACRQVRGMGS
jgi:hypothetical protein